MIFELKFRREGVCGLLRGSEFEWIREKLVIKAGNR